MRANATQSSSIDWLQVYLNAGSCSRWLRRAAGENPSGCLSSLYPKASSHSCLSRRDCKASLHVSMVWHHSFGLRYSHLASGLVRVANTMGGRRLFSFRVEALAGERQCKWRDAQSSRPVWSRVHHTPRTEVQFYSSSAYETKAQDVFLKHMTTENKKITMNCL